ncbi:hypothetical protein ERUR111494_09325 [Erysipelothrix urinaevulpis]|uniref:hypothetical protein n=1 Tax=Erysipelothrix urinaevulpis TaxID=2683717 RepID=UPI00135A3E80|nr:hypothetical protein [Erysipelothrix urinaevulpis]
MENKKVKRGIYGVVASQVIMWIQLFVMNPIGNLSITLLGTIVMLYSLFVLSKTEIWNDKMKKSFILQVISVVIIILPFIVLIRAMMKENIEALGAALTLLGLALIIVSILIFVSSIFWFLGGEPQAVAKYKAHYIIGLIVSIIITFIGGSTGSQVVKLVGNLLSIAASGLVLYVYLEYLKVIEPTIVEE